MFTITLARAAGSMAGEGAVQLIYRASTVEEFMKTVCRREVVLVVFSSPYCPYCEAYRYILASYIDRAKRESKLDKLAIVEVDVMQLPELAEKHGVYATPTTVIYSKCKPVDGFVGMVDEETLDAIVSEYIA